MYNKLYILHRKDNNNDIYWTQIGNDEQYSVEYRKNMQIKYTGSEFDTVKDFKFKDDKYTKIAQLTVNNVFKEWTNRHNYKNMQIEINIAPAEMKSIVTDIVSNMEDDTHLMYIMNTLNGRFKVNLGNSVLNKLFNHDREGWIYLIECENDKYKIGMTVDVDRRFNDLKEDVRYRAIRLLDSFHSDDARHDEAMLHKLCDMYKQNSNGMINWLQDACNSEMFNKCEEVRNIWNEYKSKSVNGDHTRIYMS